MKSTDLTKPARPTHNSRMAGKRKAFAGGMVVLGSALAAGCVSVNAPS